MVTQLVGWYVSACAAVWGAFPGWQGLLVVAAAVDAWSWALGTPDVDGPFGLCARWRGWLQNYADGRPGGAWIAKGAQCPPCVAFFVSLVVATLWVVAPWLVLPQAAWGVVVFANRYLAAVKPMVVAAAALPTGGGH